MYFEVLINHEILNSTLLKLDSVVSLLANNFGCSKALKDRMFYSMKKWMQKGIKPTVLCIALRKS